MARSFAAETSQDNQWNAAVFHRGLAEQVIGEAQRRMLINPHMVVRLSARPEAVMRDVLRQFLGMAAPAGLA